MRRQSILSQAEWQIMELLWDKPATLMELVADLSKTTTWTKSTIATMVRRMEEKGVLTHADKGRAKLFIPAVTRKEAAVQETQSLLSRAYHGSMGLLVSTMAQQNSLTKEDIDELYAILRKAEEEAK